MCFLGTPSICLLETPCTGYLNCFQCGGTAQFFFFLQMFLINSGIPRFRNKIIFYGIDGIQALLSLKNDSPKKVIKPSRAASSEEAEGCVYMLSAYLIKHQMNKVVLIWFRVLSALAPL